MFPLLPCSFGDTLAVANLALTIASALKSSSGASLDYQSLIAELHSLSQALELAYYSTEGLTSKLPKGVIDAITQEIDQCREVMEMFLVRVKGYQKALGSGGSGSSWRKIGWGVFKQQEIVALRSKLAAHRGTIILFLTTSNSCVSIVVMYKRYTLLTRMATM